MKSPHFTFYRILKILFRIPLANRGKVSTTTFIQTPFQRLTFSSAAQTNTKNNNKYTFHHRNNQWRKKKSHHKPNYEAKDCKYYTAPS